MFWFDDEDRDRVLGRIMWAGVVLFLLFGLIAYMDAEELGPKPYKGYFQYVCELDSVMYSAAIMGIEPTPELAELLIGIALGLGAPQDEGDDPHAGQPDHCSNAKEAKAPHKCECSKAEKEEGGEGCDVEDRKCKVYCRKNKCHCYHHACDS